MKIDTWVTSAGGPLMLLPENLLPYWEGINPPSDGRKIEANFRWDPTGPATDYDRACETCEMTGYINLLEVGSDHALVLGDMPMPTAWWPIPSIEGGLLVRWLFADNDNSVMQALKSLSIDAFQPAELAFNVTFPALTLFDSAWGGVEIHLYPSETLTITLKEGLYGVSTLTYTPDSETSLVLHKLSPLPDS
jgi:hypothetical protein